MNIRFRQELSNPKNAYFTKIVLSATGLTHSPYCKLTDGKYSEKCLDDLTLGVTDHAFKEVYGMNTNFSFGGGGMGRPSKAQKQFEVDDSVYLSNNPVYVRVKASVIDMIRTKVNDDQAVERIKTKIFPSIREKLLEKIKQHVQDPEAQKLMVDKVTAIEWDGTGCFSASEQNQSLPMFLLANAFYKYCESGVSVNTSSNEDKPDSGGSAK